MAHTAREKVLWSIGILVVLLYALVPVVWIASLSLKEPADIADRKFLPTGGMTLDNYTRSSTRTSSTPRS